MGKTSRQRHMLWDTRESCHRSFMEQDRRRRKVEGLGTTSMVMVVCYKKYYSYAFVALQRITRVQDPGAEIDGSFQSDLLVVIAV